MDFRNKIYLDTSVISFLYADDAPEKQEITIDFFDNFIKQEFIRQRSHNLFCRKLKIQVIIY